MGLMAGVLQVLAEIMIMKPSILLLTAALLWSAAAQADQPKFVERERHRYLIKGDDLAIARFGIGLSLDEQTPAAAVRWFRLAAEQGLAVAQHNLGSLYAKGRGVPQDDAKAAHWFRLAAEQGLPISQGALGYMYMHGRGVSDDDVEAVRWLRPAARQGRANSRLNLGIMYATGRGTEKDLIRAYAWISLAAGQGLALAQEALQRLVPHMTQGQVDIAKAVAEGLRHATGTENAA